MKELFLIAGARPNFMKVAPLYRALQADGRLPFRLVHTGQHYSAALSDTIMSDLGLPAADDHLDVGAGTPSRQTAAVLDALDPLLVARQPAAVLVVGDVTSTVAAALAASNRQIPVAHVEAGLRSGDWSMPEERNRVVVDRLARWLFVSEPSGLDNLKREGLERGVHHVGNVMIDSLEYILPKTDGSDVRTRLGLDGAPYSVLTLHRPGNVDGDARFQHMLEVLAPLAATAPLLFPVHPRTRPMLERFELPPGLQCVEPMGYLDFVALVRGAALVLTDSGGLQEETTCLDVPCLTLRPNTERPITIAEGSNELVDADGARIREFGLAALAGRGKRGTRPALWDGHTAERIVEILVADLLADGPASETLAPTAS